MDEIGRIWVDPRDGKAWRIVRAWIEPGPYRAGGSPEARRLVVPTVRFLHPPDAVEARQAGTARRPVRQSLQDLGEDELMLLLDDATSSPESA